MPKRDRWSSDDEDEQEGGRDVSISSSKGQTISSSTTIKTTEQSSCAPIKSEQQSEKNGDITSNGSSSDTTQTQLAALTPPPGYRLHNPLLHGCRSVYESYERLSHLDEGTYGIVWKARDNSTKEIVALKQIKFDNDMTKEGFPISALREISVLLSLNHECIVTVREMVVGDTHDKVFMVMECMECDLQAAMQKYASTTPFAQSEVKYMMHQLLSAMEHVHEHWFIHRDVKTSNILVHDTGRIALCDFGLARKYEEPARKMTQMVVTLWYRSSELLFGESLYGPEIDMWSIGCIFGELLVKDAILKGTGELDQIQKIFKLLGTPSDDDWPEFSSLPSSGTFKWKNRDVPELGRRFQINSFSATGQSYLDSTGFDLLSKLLTLNPRKRISAKDALKHNYFESGVKRQRPEFFIT